MRVMVVWCPDWPVIAALAEEELPADLPAGVLSGHRVLAASRAARSAGVRSGMRQREAQSRCPEIILLEHRPERDARAFEPVLGALEELRPGVAPIRPGLCAFRAPGRYYGSESAAAALIAERVVALGVWDCRIGVADTVFAAEQASRLAGVQDSLIVEPGRAASFLSTLPLDVLDDPEMVSLLRRLGIATLGGFAALPADAVHTRFGSPGLRFHRMARGLEAALPGGRTPPPQWERRVEFEPPLDSSETVAFSVRRAAEDFVARLAEHGVVCTGVRIEVTCEGALADARSWLHPRWFDAPDLVDRVRWQLDAAVLEHPIEAVLFVPETVESLGEHADGLWGGAPEERVTHAIARVQSMVGHDAVGIPVVHGGRSPAARQSVVPWGERPTGLRPGGLPWPGAIPEPAPALVFAEPRQALVVGDEGRPVGVTGRGAVTASPSRFQPVEGEPEQPVAAWAGPWPIDELWWDEAAARRIARFQIVGADGRAWLMTVEDGQWWTEASYD